MAEAAKVADTGATSADAGAGAGGAGAVTDLKTIVGGVDTGADAGSGGDAAAQAAKVAADGAQGYWPNDWRTNMAGTDNALLKRLERFESPAAILRSFQAAEQKISSGELRAPFPNEGKPEEQAAWRKQNGVPDAPEGYNAALEKLPDGLVIGEADKPFVDEFLKTAHARNAPPELVRDVVSWFFASQEQQQAALYEKNEAFKTTTEDALRTEWGQDFRPNVNRIGALLATLPAGVTDMITSAVMPDGMLLANHPDFMRGMAQLAREINPISTVVPGAGGNIVQAIETELKTLSGMMGDRQSAYWQGPEAAKNQARYRELLDAQTRSKR